MKKYGLIGNPISTSKSPALFIAGYSGKYVYDLIEESDFDTAYGRFLDGYEGINVTAPFKELAFQKADRLSDVCARIKATNLLVKKKNRIEAYNTDFDGIILSVIDVLLPDAGYDYYSLYGDDFSIIRKLLKSIYQKKPLAMIAGCGGAGRAAAAAAAEMGYDTVLVNRTVEKAVKIAGDMPGYGFRTAGLDRFRELFTASDLVIYTIPERISEIDGIGKECYADKEKIILEANYKNPSFREKELEMIRDCGSVYIPGRKWLAYQAFTGFRILTGETPDFVKISKVL